MINSNRVSFQDQLVTEDNLILYYVSLGSGSVPKDLEKFSIPWTPFIKKNGSKRRKRQRSQPLFSVKVSTAVTVYLSQCYCTSYIWDGTMLKCCPIRRVALGGVGEKYLN